ncbi:hypothetical protein ACFV23_25635 [Streptomyces sp. NPDC059627]
MPGLMHAADVLVQNAGGLTSLEAFAAGLPVASYRCIPGHGLTNAAALDAAGVAAWIRDPDRLKDVLVDLAEGPRGLLQREAGRALFAAPGAGPADEIARACRTTTATPYPLGGLGPTSPQSPVAGPPGPVAGAAGGAPVPRGPRPAVRRLAASVAAACALWAGAVGTAVATTGSGPGVIHAIGHTLDLDDAHGPGAVPHTARPKEGPHS